MNSVADLAKQLLELAQHLGLNVGFSTVAVVIVLAYLFNNPAKFDAWGALASRAALSIAGGYRSFRGRLDRNAVAWGIQEEVNRAGARLSAESPEAMPYKLRVRWVSGEQVPALIDDGEVVVCLRDHRNQAVNVVTASNLFVRKALLPRAKIYMERSLHEACILLVLRKILSDTRTEEALDIFFDRVMDPALKEIPNLGDDLEMVEDLDASGLLSRTFFPTVKRFGDRLYPTTPSARDRSEIQQVARFLLDLANKRSGEDVPLLCDTGRIRLSFVLVARQGRLESEGFYPYKRRILLNLRAGLNPVYVAGWGADNAYNVLQLVKLLRGEGADVLVWEYSTTFADGGSAPMTLVRCGTSPEVQARLENETRPVVDVLRDNVPEIAAGEVEIVAISRNESGSKVLVRQANDHSDSWPAVGACLGQGSARLSRIRKALDERVYIVGWRPDVCDLTIEALGVPRDAVAECSLDETEQRVVVTLDDDEALRMAIGKGGSHINLVREIVGWHIEMRLTEEAEQRSKAAGLDNGAPLQT